MITSLVLIYEKKGRGSWISDSEVMEVVTKETQRYNENTITLFSSKAKGICGIMWISREKYD